MTHARTMKAEQPFDAELYRSSYYTLSASVKTIESINLERDYRLVHPPVDYDAYVDTVAKAQSLLANFTGNVWADLKGLPGMITASSTTAYVYFATACGQLQQLCAATGVLPENYLRLSLEMSLQNIADLLGTEQRAIARMMQDMEQCNGEFLAVARLLRKVAAMALQDRNANLEQVEELYAAIADMKRELKTVSAQLAHHAATAARAGSMAVVGFTMTGRGGLIVSIFSGLIAAVAAQKVALDTARLASLQQRIDCAATTADEYATDAAQLLSLADDFTVHASLADEMRTCLKQLYAVWSTLNEEMLALLEGVHEVSALSGLPATLLHSLLGFTWENVYRRMQALESDYRQVVVQAGELNVSGINGCTATLHVGMSSEEVSATLEAAEPMELIEYLTAG